MRQNEMSGVGLFGKWVSLLVSGVTAFAMLASGCGSSSRAKSVGGEAAASFSAEDVAFKVVVGKRQGNQPDLTKSLAEAESIDDALAMNRDVSFTSLIRLLPESSENGSFLVWPAFVNGKEIREVTYSREFEDDLSKHEQHANSERLLGRRTADNQYWFIPLEEVAGKLEDVSPTNLFRIKLELRFADHSEQVRVSLRLIGRFPELGHTTFQAELPAKMNQGKALADSPGGWVVAEETFRNPANRFLALDLGFPKNQGKLVTEIYTDGKPCNGFEEICVKFTFRFELAMSVAKVRIIRDGLLSSERSLSEVSEAHPLHVELPPGQEVRVQYVIDRPAASSDCRLHGYPMTQSNLNVDFQRSATLVDPTIASAEPEFSKSLAPFELKLEGVRESGAPRMNPVLPGNTAGIWSELGCSGLFGDDV